MLMPHLPLLSARRAFHITPPLTLFHAASHYYGLLFSLTQHYYDMSPPTTFQFHAICATIRWGRHYRHCHVIITSLLFHTPPLLSFTIVAAAAAVFTIAIFSHTLYCRHARMNGVARYSLDAALVAYV